MTIPDFRLERFFARWEFVAPFLLGASDAESYRIDELLALADRDGQERWAKLWLGYTESLGHPLLRAEIAALYPGLSAEDVMVFAGAEEAIFTFCNVALSAGDHAVVMWPAYQSLEEVARSTGAEVSRLELRGEKSWWLDLGEFESLLRPTTKLAVINVPHNPTGMHPDHQTFSQLASLCEQRGITLFCDEVYRYAEYDPEHRLPGACEMSDTAASLGALSKPFGLAGLRIGWIATRDRQLRKRLHAFKDYLTICSSAPSEVLALIALRAKDTLLDRNMAIVARNLELVASVFAKHADVFEWIAPRAGLVAFPRLRLSIPIDEFATRLVETTGVLIVPGTVFEHEGNHFRVGLGRKNVPAALDRLQAFLETEAAVR
jgi:aspartate/methionine/tyrosine aminotransferase